MNIFSCANYSRNSSYLNITGGTASEGVALSEQRLFQAIILQAFVDATARIGKHKYCGHTKATVSQARTWLINNVIDFEMVCTYAGVDPITVRKTAQRMKRHGWPRLNRQRCERTHDRCTAQRQEAPGAATATQSH